MRFPRFPRLVSRTLFRIARSIPANPQDAGPDPYRDVAARLQRASYQQMAQTPGKSTVDVLKIRSYQEQAKRQLRKNEILGMPYGGPSGRTQI